MKHIKLRKLILNEFKGFTFTLDANGEDLSVMGANATGKTTLADGFAWLLFDKDSLGRSDFEIKNLDASGEAEHGLEHGVEATLDVNGTVITLKKIYREIWTKKRGSPKAVFTGNTTDYFLNGVPIQKKDYVATVADIAGDEAVFKLLTTPVAFPSLHWTKQRALLLEVCGDITDSEVIRSDSKLAALTEILTNRTLEDHKKVVAARRTEINKELERIPVRIDEQKRIMPDVTGLDQKTIIKEVSVLETEINDAKLRLSGIDNGGAIAELSKQIQSLNHDLGELQNKYYVEGMKHVTRMNAQINEITTMRDSEARQVKGLKDDITAKQARIASLETDMQTLREKWTAIDAEEFLDTTESVCYACGHPLDPDKVEDARTKALAHFNNDKAERLLKIETRGKELRTDLNREKEIIAQMHQELTNRPNMGDADLEALKTERDTLKAKAEDYSNVPGREGILLQIAELDARIQLEKDGHQQDRDAVQKEIDALTAQLKEVKEKADRFTRREQGNSRIQELMNSEKQLTAEFEKLEGELFLMEQFIRAKVAMLTEKINGLFEFARFKLFDVQVNGGISECCEITVNGVPFNSGLNNAARINAGLDVCRTLAVHYGLQAPVFVDNAESVCELINMDAQVVRLIVSEPDKALRVEAGKKRMAA